MCTPASCVLFIFEKWKFINAFKDVENCKSKHFNGKENMQHYI